MDDIATKKKQEETILEAEVSKPDSKGVWLKDGTLIKADPRLEMTVEGTVHKLLIKHAYFDDNGEYTLLVDYLHTKAKLTVIGILLLLNLLFIKYE